MRADCYERLGELVKAISDIKYVYSMYPVDLFSFIQATGVRWAEKLASRMEGRRDYIIQNDDDTEYDNFVSDQQPS